MIHIDKITYDMAVIAFEEYLQNNCGCDECLQTIYELQLEALKRLKAIKNDPR